MNIAATIGKVLAGIVFWAFIIDWVFLDGYYNPYIGEDSITSATESNSRQEKTKSLAAATKANPIEIYATTLFQDFQENRDAASGKFTGKFVIVSGLYFSITGTSMESQSNVFIFESEYIGLFTDETVHCEMATTETQKLISKYGVRKKTEFDDGGVFDPVRLNNHTPIKLKGKVNGPVYNGVVELVNCTLF